LRCPDCRAAFGAWKRRLEGDALVSDGCARRRYLGDDVCVDDPVNADAYPDIPRIPASAGALIFDEAGRLLILKPNYKPGWTIPGGQVDANGESPWDACRRETLEECGLKLEHARLVCVDFLSPRPQRPDAAHRPSGVRFLFDCATFSDEHLKMIVLQAEEIDDYRLAEMDEALALLSGPLRRRVSKAAGAKRCLYLENGRRVPGVGR
jgi:8-oxo-dGTP diphosphatase